MAAQPPSLGSCTRITFGGTSGTVASMSILFFKFSLTVCRVSAWCAKGTVKQAISPNKAASSFKHAFESSISRA